MSGPLESRRRHNPFDARYLRPGTLPYLFPQHCDLSEIIAKLEANGWRGEIVGPHGSGKSTLIASLLPALAAQGIKSASIALHAGDSGLPRAWLRQARTSGARIIVVDGYEQLTSFNRWRLKWACRRRGAGLLVTSHAPTGLPELLRTAVDLKLAQQVVDLLAANTAWRPSDADLQAAFLAHQGNLREMLFAMYDLYERQAR